MVSSHRFSASDMALWSSVHPSLEVVKEGSVVRPQLHAHQDSRWALADPIMCEGVHAFSVFMGKDHMAGLALGVAAVASKGSAGDVQLAWGYNPYEGAVYCLDALTDNSSWCGAAYVKTITGPMRSSSCTVTVTVNMESRRLFFSVAGAPAVDAGVRLPAAVRLWGHVYHTETPLTICDYFEPICLVLTLDACPCQPDGAFCVSALTLGGKKLVSLTADGQQPVFKLRCAIRDACRASGGHLQLVLPSGRLLAEDGDDRSLAEVLSQPASGVDLDGSGDVDRLTSQHPSGFSGVVSWDEGSEGEDTSTSQSSSSFASVGSLDA